MLASSKMNSISSFSKSFNEIRFSWPNMILRSLDFTLGIVIINKMKKIENMNLILKKIKKSF